MANGSLTLDSNELLVVVNIKPGTVSILDLPHHDNGNFDWITSLVVDSNDVALKVVGFGRHGGFFVERIYPKEAVALNSAFVITKEHKNTSLARLNRVDAT